MKTRILSGLIMAPLLVLVFVGGYILTAACLLIGIFTAYEFYHAFGIRLKTAVVITIVLSVLLYLTLFINTSFIMLWIFLTVGVSLLLLFKPKKYELQDSFVLMAGNFYIVFFVFHVPLIVYTFFGGIQHVVDPVWIALFTDDAVHFGRDVWPILYSNPVWLVLFTAFGTDIFAYFIGVTFGKHKLCPDLSPKKSIEGAVGGILGSAIVCGLFGWFARPEIFVHCIVIGLLGSIFAQFGDLSASAIKRKLGVKDYSKLIPGHGGILDRFDSVLFTAPFVYYYLNILGYVKAFTAAVG
ncbi:MAG: phosphatidate cytidylyltransferase [Clostridiales Family XIII bacterium]|jgi:phosphatidate cytidylyltransferase|nr:phosphatidate cytidylyltransferase [Clostridiales Family XIII bacterium]